MTVIAKQCAMHAHAPTTESCSSRNLEAALVFLDGVDSTLPVGRSLGGQDFPSWRQH